MYIYNDYNVYIIYYYIILYIFIIIYYIYIFNTYISLYKCNIKNIYLKYLLKGLERTKKTSKSSILLQVLC